MKTPFENIKLSQLYALCHLLATSKIKDFTNIKSKYSRSALAFDATLTLLQDLKLLKQNSGELSLAQSFERHTDSIDNFRLKILPVLFSTNNYISEHLREFLTNFRMHSDSISFRATDIEKIKFSDTRNLLIELEFISVGPDSSTYYINSPYVNIFIEQFAKKQFDPAALKLKQRENEILGLNAEKAVVDYEKKRLTNIEFELSEIELISEKNTAAGFDIISFENFLDHNSKRIHRYIEVKAVSDQDYRFYMSKSEIEIAKVFGDKYFLYLLPVTSNGNFDFAKLLTINDPYNNIYLNRNKWKKQEESVSFSKWIDE
jgi:hypothetical protein